jgi:tetratricopeptide (TPR) repeat protein/outer membrane protein assembly factor BamB
MELLKLIENQLKKKAVGTLTLGKKKFFREAFFEGDSVYMVGQVFSGKIALGKLLSMGLLGQRLSLEKFEGLVLTTDLTRRMLPQVLHEQGLLTDAELKELVEEQLTEELVDLLFRNPGSFHFQEGRVPEYLLKCEEITTRVSISLIKVFEEMKKRTELAAAYDLLIPSYEEVFILTEKGLALRQQEKNDFVLQRIVDLLDGLRNLRSIIKDTYFYEFQVIGWIVRALDAGHIKKTIHPELKGLSTQNFSRDDVERYLPYFKNAVKYGVDELAARERLAVVYEKIAKIEEAVVQYNFIGDALYRMRKAAKAIKAYQRALSLKPDETLITNKVTKIYREAAEQELSGGNSAQAIQLLEEALRFRPGDRDLFTRLLFLLVREKKLKEIYELCDTMVNYSKKLRAVEPGVEACKQIMHELPKHTAIRKKLVNLYLDFGMTAEASAEMQVVAKLFVDRGEMEKAQEIVEKIRRIGGVSPDLKVLERRLSSAPRSKKSLSRRKHRKLTRVLLGLTLAFAAYQAWGCFVWNEIRGREAVAQARGPDRGEAASVLPSSEEARWVELARQCSEFLHTFPLSLVGLEARKLGQEAQENADRLAALRGERKQSILREAERSAREGKRSATEALLRPLLEDLEDNDCRRKAEAILGEVRQFKLSAKELYEKGKELFAKEDWRGAYRAHRQIMETYPQSELIKELKLPVLVESLPSAAAIHEITSQGEKRRLGTTPLLVFLPPGGALDVEMSSQGYAILKTEIRDMDGEGKLFLLSRQPAWTATLDGPMEARAAFLKDSLIGSTSQGSIVGMEASTGAVLWQRAGNSVQSLFSPPVPAAEGVYTLWNNGNVLRFSPRPAKGGNSSKPGSPEVTAEFFLGSLATSPLHAVRGTQLLAVGTKAGNVQAYHRPSASPAWSIPIDGLATTLSDGDEAVLLVGTQAGQLLKVDARSPAVLWKRPVSSAGCTEAFSIGKGIVVLTKKNELVCLRADDGQRVFSKAFPQDAMLCMAPGEGRIFLSERKGELSMVSPETAEVVKSRDLGVDCEALLPLSGALGVIHDKKKGLLLVDSESLEPIWAAKAHKPILMVTANERWVVVSTEGGKLVAYPRGK